MITGELTWQQFRTLDSIRNLSENRQLHHYHEYLVELNEWIIHQNKGDLIRMLIKCTDGMDIVFLVDNTGSMGSAINAIKTAIASIVSAIVTQSGNNYRLGLVVFDEIDPNGTIFSYTDKPAYTNLPASQKYVNEYIFGDPQLELNRTQYITALEIMSQNNQSSFISQLSLLNTASLPIGDGALDPEPSDIGIDRIVNYDITGIFRDNVTKLIILITDQPSSGYDDINDATDVSFANTLVTNCNAKGIKVMLMKADATSYAPLETIATGTSGLVSNSYTPEAIVTSLQNICATI